MAAEPKLLYSLMTLESGLYIIQNCGNLVGRALAEDRSLLPKKVFSNTDNPGARVKYNTLDVDNRAENDIFCSGALKRLVKTNTSFLLTRPLLLLSTASSMRS